MEEILKAAPINKRSAQIYYCAFQTTLILRGCCEYQKMNSFFIRIPNLPHHQNKPLEEKNFS